MVSFLSALYLPSCHVVLSPAGLIQTLALSAGAAGRLHVALWVKVGDGSVPGPGDSKKMPQSLLCFSASRNCLCTVTLLYWDVILLQNYVPATLNLMWTSSCIQPCRFKGRSSGGILRLNDMAYIWQIQNGHPALGSNQDTLCVVMMCPRQILVLPKS